MISPSLAHVLVLLVGFAVLMPGLFALQLAPSGSALMSLWSILGWGLALVLLPLTTPAAWRRGLMAGLVLVAAYNAAIGIVQVVSPSALMSGWWVPDLVAPGRATGNYRQPNHLATVLLWGLAALAWLGSAAGDGRRWPVLTGLGLATLMLLVALVLTGSRTGLFLGLPLMVVWAVFDRSLRREVRIALAALPVLALLVVLLSHWLASAGSAPLGGAERLLHEGASGGSRTKLWRDAWALLQLNPGGVGWGEFNRAWTLLPIDDRAPHYYDNAHNLFLHLLVELGWLRGGALTLALLWAVGWMLKRAWSSGQVAQRTLGVMLLIVGVHSMLEFPLWFPYFLLPTLAMGALMVQTDEAWTWPHWVPKAGALVGLLMVFGAVWGAKEYLALSAIYAKGLTKSVMVDRVVAGHQTLFFSRQADYAAATVLGVHPIALASAKRTSHVLIDSQLLKAWAINLHAAGDTDKARWLVARLAEFRRPEAQDWLNECRRQTDLWYCSAPSRTYTHRDF